MGKRDLLLALGGALLVAACAKVPDEAHPVSWYSEHPNDMRSKVTWCVDDATRRSTPDCQNALEAKRRLQVGSQKDLAPIDWGRGSKPSKPSN